MKKTLRREHMGYVYILPWIIGFLVFQLYPLAASLYYSFTSYNITSAPVWVGLENYVTMFTKDSQFFSSLLTTLKYVFMSVPMKICFALLVAVILNQKIRFINFYRTVLYIPSIFGGSVAVAILWRFLFMDSGLINQILRALGVPAVQWLSSPKIALFTLSLLSVWQFGSSMVLFLAALKQVPEDLHEAARIDGATNWQTLWKVTIPNMMSSFTICIFLTLTNGFKLFDQNLALTGGRPFLQQPDGSVIKTTEMLALNIYNAFYSGGGNNRGVGQAKAVGFFILVAVIGLIQLQATRKKEVQQ